VTLPAPQLCLRNETPHFPDDSFSATYSSRLFTRAMKRPRVLSPQLLWGERSEAPSTSDRVDSGALCFGS